MPNYDPRLIMALAGRPGSVQAAERQIAQNRLQSLFQNMRNAGGSVAGPQGGPSPIAARRQELMAQGMSHGEAMQQMAQEGLIPRAFVDKVTSVTAAVPK